MPHEATPNTGADNRRIREVGMQSAGRRKSTGAQREERHFGVLPGPVLASPTIGNSNRLLGWLQGMNEFRRSWAESWL